MSHLIWHKKSKCFGRNIFFNFKRIYPCWILIRRIKSFGSKSLATIQTRDLTLIQSCIETSVSDPLIFTGRSGSIGYGSSWKCLQIQNVKPGNLSTTLLIICFGNYRDEHVKTGRWNRKLFHNLTDPKSWLKLSLSQKLL